MQERLKESVDLVWDSMGEKDPAMVCRRMHEAVRTALEGAKDMDGLQETLAQLPEYVVVEICKNILHACKDMWPHISSHFQAAAAAAASRQQQMGGPCGILAMCGAGP